MRGCSLGDFFRLGQRSGMACTVKSATVASGRTMCTCRSLHQGHWQHRQVHDLVRNRLRVFPSRWHCSRAVPHRRRSLARDRLPAHVRSRAYLSARKALFDPSMGINRFFKTNPFGRLSGRPTHGQSVARRTTVWETSVAPVSHPRNLVRPLRPLQTLDAPSGLWGRLALYWPHLPSPSCIRSFG